MTNTPAPIASLDRLRGPGTCKVVPYGDYTYSATAMEAVRRCNRIALSREHAARDLLMDRLDEMSADERAETDYAARCLS